PPPGPPRGITRKAPPERSQGLLSGDDDDGPDTFILYFN
ncbi:unnamed protein product, partial [marine sediment metagenome]